MIEVPKDYDLVFYKKPTKESLVEKIFYVKRITSMDLRFFNPETGEFGDVTRYELNKHYRSDPINKKMSTQKRTRKRIAA